MSQKKIKALRKLVNKTHKDPRIAKYVFKVAKKEMKAIERGERN